jgi:hypothetical protein
VQQSVVVERRGGFWRYVILAIILIVVFFLCYIAGVAGDACNSLEIILGISGLAIVRGGNRS